MNEHLKVIMTKMCEVVGADYPLIDFQKEGWFLEYQWDIKTEEEYIIWLKQYLRDNKDARKFLLKHNKISGIDQAVKEFIILYGWQYKK